MFQSTVKQHRIKTVKQGPELNRLYVFATACILKMCLFPSSLFSLAHCYDPLLRPLDLQQEATEQLLKIPAWPVRCASITLYQMIKMFRRNFWTPLALSSIHIYISDIYISCFIHCFQLVTRLSDDVKNTESRI